MFRGRGYSSRASCLLLAGCGSGFQKGFPSYISAPNNVLRVGQTVQLTTETAITGSPLAFWVNGVPGGNAEVGTVDSNGLYTAPAITPSPNNIVTITSLATHFRRTRRAR